MRHIYLFLEFYKSTLLANMILSSFSLLFALKASSFCIVFCSFGLIASIIYKEYFNRPTFYFYYNNSLSKSLLYLLVFLFNILISTIILVLFYG